MSQPGTCQGVGVWHPVDLPRATTQCPGGKPGKLGLWLRRMLPPGHRVVGLRQIDGMPHNPQRARSSMILNQQSITTSVTPRTGRR
jgi:hypothetical protein